MNSRFSNVMLMRQRSFRLTCVELLKGSQSALNISTLNSKRKGPFRIK